MTSLFKKSIKDDAKESKKEELDFNDTPPPSKAPWILMGACVVAFGVVLQIGLSFFSTDSTGTRENSREETQEVERDYKKGLRADVESSFDEEKEMLKQKLLTLSEALASKNKEVADARGAQKNNQSLLSKVKEKVSLQDNEMDRLLKAPVSINIGVKEASPQNKKSSFKDQASAIENKINAALMGLQSDDNPNDAFLKKVSDEKFPTENAVQIERLDLKILQGKQIEGVLDGAISSALPDMIVAHVTKDVYSEDGSTLLIPIGSKLIGQYRSGNYQTGDTRVYIVWERLTMPKGISIRIDSAGSDSLGRAGMSGDVNTHFFERFGTSILSTVLSFGSATSGVGDMDNYNSKSAYRMAASQAFAKTASDELRRNGNIPPTIDIPQGKRIIIKVRKDLSFEGVARGLLG